MISEIFTSNNTRRKFRGRCYIRLILELLNTPLCFCCRVLPEGKEGNLPDSETCWTATRSIAAPPISTSTILAWDRGGGKYSTAPWTHVSAASTHWTFRPTNMTSTYSVCTRRVFGGIGHRTLTLRSGESDALVTRLPTAFKDSQCGRINAL
ncbi:hypothetical protein TNCV_3559231 [Trichonephila clavipes]|uniref:Uncharacterized protein n=1 Tax=Trichonephila clavipes TaxID=2585209 RepID=A0A8X7BIE8_TRICX|nr:hypothetical protein TNCV_3559231 [Trichonephila clavipes]